MQAVQAGGEMVSGMLQTRRTLLMVTAVPPSVSAADDNCVTCGFYYVSGTVPHGSCFIDTSSLILGMFYKNIPLTTLWDLRVSENVQAVGNRSFLPPGVVTGISCRLHFILLFWFGESNPEAHKARILILR